MKLTWIGHACFKLEHDDYTVIFDPYKDGSGPGLQNIREEADQVLCSHEHGDHSGRECVTLRAEKESPFAISEIHTFHDEVKGAKRGSSTIYILEADGMRIVHMGDIGCELEPEQVAQLKNVDVMMIPVGGFYTIDAGQASVLVRQVNPKVIIPMHFSKGNIGYSEISTVDGFLEGKDNVVISESSSVNLTDVQEPAIVVLTPENSAANK